MACEGGERSKPFLLGPAQLHLSPSGTVKRTNGEGNPIHRGLGRPIQVRVSDSAARPQALARRPAAAAHSERPGQRRSRRWPAGWASATAQASQEALRRAALRPRPPSPQVPRSARFRWRRVPRAGPKWRWRRVSPEGKCHSLPQLASSPRAEGRDGESFWSLLLHPRRRWRGA